MTQSSPQPGSSAAFATAAIHGAPSFDNTTGAVIPPIYQTSTFAAGNPGGFDYTRSGNPNFRQLDAVVAQLEQAAYATSFGSGVAAITAVVSSLDQNSVVLAEENVYGCTYRLFAQVFKKFGVTVHYRDLSDPDQWSAIEELKPTLLWLESPTNPLLKVLDLPALSQRAHAVGTTVLVDNTFASPWIQCPLLLGADISLSSATKYLNGHSDALCGVVCCNDRNWHDKMVFAQKALGLQPDPFAAWLTMRGIKTLDLRMQRHCDNALQLAQWLEQQPAIKQVRYPFLPSHPQYALAQGQMKAGGGIITCELAADATTARAFCDRLQYFTLAESLGGIESLACHPATMTHASVPAEVRAAVGLHDGVIRLSVGIEAVEDLQADLATSLQQLDSADA